MSEYVFSYDRSSLLSEYVFSYDRSSLWSEYVFSYDRSSLLSEYVFIRRELAVVRVRYNTVGALSRQSTPPALVNYSYLSLSRLLEIPLVRVPCYGTEKVRELAPLGLLRELVLFFLSRAAIRAPFGQSTPLLELLLFSQLSSLYRDSQSTFLSLEKKKKALSLFPGPPSYEDFESSRHASQYKKIIFFSR